jgi:hypothetical protein
METRQMQCLLVNAIVGKNMNVQSRGNVYKKGLFIRQQSADRMAG